MLTNCTDMRKSGTLKWVRNLLPLPCAVLILGYVVAIKEAIFPSPPVQFWVKGTITDMASK